MSKKEITIDRKTIDFVRDEMLDIYRELRSKKEDGKPTTMTEFMLGVYEAISIITLDQMTRASWRIISPSGIEWDDILESFDKADETDYEKCKKKVKKEKPDCYGTSRVLKRKSVTGKPNCIFCDWEAPCTAKAKQKKKKKRKKKKRSKK